MTLDAEPDRRQRPASGGKGQQEIPTGLRLRRCPRFRRKSGIIGRKITLSMLPVEIVGVMPRDFALFRDDVDAWLPGEFTDMEEFVVQDMLRGMRHSNIVESVAKAYLGGVRIFEPLYSLRPDSTGKPKWLPYEMATVAPTQVLEKLL